MNNVPAAQEETTLYVLELRGGRYYVGSTNNLDRRYAEHLAGQGSAWTARYPPTRIVQRQRGNRFHEDAIVLTYMSRYGVENVRGGTYSSVELPRCRRAEIQRQLRHGGNQCFNCGSSNHFAYRCPALGQQPPEQEPQHQRRRVECIRCGRSSHTAEDCFAATRVNGTLLFESNHDESSSVSESGNESDSGDSVDLHCTRCGRNSHTIQDCFASYGVDGRPLSR